MEYAYATCILNETGEEINEANLTAVLEAAGSDVQSSRVKAIVAALEDIDISNVTEVDAATLENDASGVNVNGIPMDAMDEDEVDGVESDIPAVENADDGEPADADTLEELDLVDEEAGANGPSSTHDAAFEEDDQPESMDVEE